MPLDDRVHLSVEAAVNRVNQAIAAAELRLFDERRRQNALATARERDVDRVVHPSGHDDVDRGISGAPPKDVRRTCHERCSARPLVCLFREGPLGPVDPAVRTEIGSVQIVGAPGERFPLKPFLPAIGHAIAVGVGQLPDAWRCGHVERAVEPHRPFRETSSCRQTRRSGRSDRRRRCPRAARCDVADLRAAYRPCRSNPTNRRRKPSVIIEIGHDRPVDERRPGDAFDGKARSDGEDRSGEGAAGCARGAARKTRTMPASIPIIPDRLILSMAPPRAIKDSRVRRSIPFAPAPSAPFDLLERRSCACDHRVWRARSPVRIDDAARRRRPRTSRRDPQRGSVRSSRRLCRRQSADSPGSGLMEVIDPPIEPIPPRPLGPSSTVVCSPIA